MKNSHKILLFTLSLLLAVLVISVSIFKHNRLQYSALEKNYEIDSTKIEQEIIRMFGVPVDSFNLLSNVIKKNQTLLSILVNLNLPKGALQNLLEHPPTKFDLRKIKAGNKYFLFFEKDSLSTLRHLVYELNAIDFIHFEFIEDSVLLTEGKKEVIQKQQRATGTIKSSLWNEMVDNNYNPLLAVELSEIFAWSIDFFGLQPSDSFSIVYDQIYVDSITIGYGKIYAAYFWHDNKAFYAIPFEQDSVQSYFSLDGASLRKAFLKAPLRFSRISSRYSNSRLHPVLKIHRAHHGVDYAAPVGTPVQAIGDGKIIEASYGYNNGGGNFIKIRHNSIYTSGYLHLSKFAEGVHAGVEVKQGDIIGYVGKTGLATGPHLDFRFYKNGNPVNPLLVESPSVEPIHPTNIQAFDSIKNITLKLLNSNNLQNQ